MKKLIMFAAAFCVAAVTQAATVQWSATNIGFSSAQSDASKYTAYLIDNGIGGYSDAAAAFAALQTSGSSASGVIHSKSGLTANSAGTAMSLTINGATLANDPGYAAGDKITAWTIIVDNTSAATASNYMFAEKLNAGVNNSLKLAVAAGTQASNTWVPVPEPTSGLLMLVGLGALALRRRRA